MPSTECRFQSLVPPRAVIYSDSAVRDDAPALATAAVVSNEQWPILKRILSGERYQAAAAVVTPAAASPSLPTCSSSSDAGAVRRPSAHPPRPCHIQTSSVSLFLPTFN